ncbi:MAG: ATP-binding protein [Ignavibacteria bacterium]|nr:ATP-binding protein [Ignavibacteria bacterium]
MNSNNKIVIFSSTKNLVTVRKFIETTAKDLGLDMKIINQIVLAVDEACTNIIKYTHKYDDKNTIEITISSEKDTVKVIIFYRGEGFDPNKVKNPDMIEYFKNYKVGGLGIPMMRKFMNKIEYKHQNPDLNTLVLIKSV